MQLGMLKLSYYLLQAGNRDEWVLRGVWSLPAIALSVVNDFVTFGMYR